MIDEELAKLNELARRELVQYPEPEGCPPGGLWVRTATLDDDHRARPEGPWHFGMGWDGSIGGYAVRCRRRRTRVSQALYSMNDRSSWSRTIHTIDTSIDRPESDACQRCTLYLARDAEAADADAVAWRLVLHLLGRLTPAGA